MSYFSAIYLTSSVTIFYVGWMRRLENQLLNMSYIWRVEKISTWRGPQVVNLPRLDTTNGELLAQLGPIASNIAEGNLSTHERWFL